LRLQCGCVYFFNLLKTSNVYINLSDVSDAGKDSAEYDIIVIISDEEKVGDGNFAEKNVAVFSVTSRTDVFTFSFRDM